MFIKWTTFKNSYVSLTNFFSFLLKICLFIYLTEVQSGHLLIIVTSLIYYLIFLAAFSIFPKEHKVPFETFFNIIVSTIMFVDCVYYSYFNQLPSLSLLNQITQLNDVTDSIFSTIKPLHILFLVDIMPLLFFVGKNRRETSYENNNKTFTYYMVAILSLFILICGITYFNINFQPYIATQEFFTYHIYDFCKKQDTNNTIVSINTFKTHDIYRWPNTFDDKSALKSSKKYFGIAKGRNIINIQVESLQNFLINKFYEGQEITPNLNKLLEKDTFYYSNYYQQLGRGNTSDAEFVTHNSLYPSMNGPTYMVYTDNTYYGLPWILKEHGYFSIAFHGYKSTFWNRDKAYPYQGFDQFISEEDYNVSEIIGMGLSDEQFFTQTVDYLKKINQPYYAFLVTLSSHNPFELPKQHQKLKLKEEHQNTLFGNYLQAIHYVDAAIGNFVNSLKDEGLYNNSIITIYGDHFGLSCKDNETKKYVSEYLGYEYDFDEMLNVPLIIHIPNSDIKEEITTVGGQIDFLPTILNIMGIENKKGIMLGQDLNNTEDGFVAQQTYIIKGSFIDNQKMFIMSRDGIFQNSRAFNLQTREPVSVKDCKAGYERAINEINKSDYILENDIIQNILMNYMENLGKFKEKQDLLPVELIAHAGGNLEGLTYTNCKEALDNSYNLGFRFIEVDLEWTNDDKLVLLHSWDGFVKKFFDKEPQRYSYEEFANFNMIHGWKQLTLENLINWIRQHPDVYIVTDVKKDNIKALGLIAEKYPDIQNQIIPQIYFMEEYLPVQEMGFKNIIFTLYMSNYNDKDIVDFAQRHKLFAVTMPYKRGISNLPRELDKIEVFTYVHTINDEKTKLELYKNGVDGVYTDDLKPKNN